MNMLTRRKFLQRSLSSIAGLTTASSLGVNLALSQQVMAQSSSRFTDYKALVCIFLYGGNDSYNLIIPTEASDYQTYQGVRQNLAYRLQELLPLNPKSAQPYAMGMPEGARSLHTLFENQRLSLVANIGPMAQPLTKTLIANDNSLLPPQLFSHNDQQSLWQAGAMNTSATTGWGGRMADLVADTNDTLSMNLSIFGNNLMQAGTLVQPFSVDASGPEAFAALDPTKNWNRDRVALFERMKYEASGALQSAYLNKLNSAAENNQRLSDALASVDESQVDYPLGNQLAAQLSMVARLIASNVVLGQSRQIFFVGMGGWDTHDAQSTLHPQLLGVLGDAMLAFQQDLEQRGISQSVTTFTQSEFGRTLTSNGDGTDHGWGGHQLIMGDSVVGGDIHGQMPSLALNSNDDIGGGRMIPGISIDQYGGALAKWFGLSNDEINTVFPNLNRFDSDAIQLFAG